MREHKTESGEVLRFPDGTSEDVVRRTAAKRAGLDPSAMQGQPPQQDSMAAINELRMISMQAAQAQVALFHDVRALVTAVRESTTAIDALRDEVAAAAQAVADGSRGAAGELKSALAEHAKGVASAVARAVSGVTAERELVFDDRNRPVGVRTKINTERGE